MKCAVLGIILLGSVETVSADVIQYSFTPIAAAILLRPRVEETHREVGKRLKRRHRFRFGLHYCKGFLRLDLDDRARSSASKPAAPLESSSVAPGSGTPVTGATVTVELDIAGVKPSPKESRAIRLNKVI
jgi:hypothetical protein